MSNKLNSQWLRSIFALVAISVFLGGCSAMGPPAFSYASQERGNKVCAGLFGISEIKLLSTKMPIVPGQLPSRDMLMINQAPSVVETQAIGTLESAIRNCALLRTAAGMPTSASEDILQARISRLRHDLYSGHIPYAVYNYGLAQALKKHTEFMVQGEQAYTQGKAAGENQLFGLTLQNLVGVPNAGPLQGSGWSCSSPSAASSPSITCR